MECIVWGMEILVYSGVKQEGLKSGLIESVVIKKWLAGITQESGGY